MVTIYNVTLKNCAVFVIANIAHFFAYNKTLFNFALIE